ncbi:hypothetical protein [Enterovibrio norvegicus]|uniref:hypothetical protein n=1 Tax=Enterovibrio norvegicus TaxID=188144 RepID=UPI000C82E8DD|nr:hypothetical protein [Enterovibrio norvegicus]PMN73757.1 hypothetical protein BCT27_01745 [Enterovibrio norvegicus]
MGNLTEIFNQAIPASSHFDLNYKLLASLCRSTELAISNSIQHYEQNGLEFEEIDVDPETGPIGFEHYDDITDHDVLDLDSTVKVHFPSMQRRSVYLTIFGVFEHELELFCKLISRKNSTKIEVTDFKGSGIERSALYLNKCMDIRVSTTMLRKLQKLRNICAHQDAKYKLPDGQDIQEITTLVNANPDLLELDQLEGKVILKAGFLDWALGVIYDFFRDIEQ